MTHPLTKDDLVQINDALKAIRATREVIERAKIAGIDLELQETTINDAETKLKAIKAGFFPTGR